MEEVQNQKIRIFFRQNNHLDNSTSDTHLLLLCVNETAQVFINIVSPQSTEPTNLLRIQNYQCKILNSDNISISKLQLLEKLIIKKNKSDFYKKQNQLRNNVRGYNNKMRKDRNICKIRKISQKNTERLWDNFTHNQIIHLQMSKLNQLKKDHYKTTHQSKANQMILS